MSTTTLAPPQSPVEFVQSLPPAVRSEVLLSLLQELIALSGGEGLISITTPEGKPFGHYVPPAVEKARSEAALAEMPPEVRARMTAPLPDDFDPDDCLSEAEVTAIMRAAPVSRP